MSAHGTEARVHALPLCDFCKDADNPVDAAYDGRSPWGWAYMCEQHWQEFGPGKVGLGIGQRLVVDTEPEPDPDCTTALEAAIQTALIRDSELTPVEEAIANDAFLEAMGEASILELLAEDLSDPTLLD